MSNQWYYTKDGKTKVGPLSETELEALALSGHLQPTDMVLKDGMQKWMSASQIDGLFTANESGSQLPSPPPMDQVPVVLATADSTEPTKKDTGKKPPLKTEQPKGILASISVFANKAQAKIQETVQEVGGKVKEAVKDGKLQNAISGITGQIPKGAPTKASEKNKTQDVASAAQDTVKDGNVTQSTAEAPQKLEPLPSSESGATPGAPASPSLSKPSTTKAPASPPTPKWDENEPATWRAIQGHAGILDVYEDKVIITPQGVLGFVTRGLAGTCEVPFRTITAIQFREGGPLFTGYITFDVPGVVGGMFRGDRGKSNTFIFRQDRNSLMKKIKQYVEGRMQEINGRSAAPPSASSKADELMKLAGLLKDGHITQEEFTQMKADLLSRQGK